MVDSRGGRRFAIFFFVAAFLILFLGRFLHPVRNVTMTAAAPFAAVISGAANAVGDTITGITQGGQLRDQNLRLRAQLAQVLAENAVLQQEARENRQFRTLLRFDTANPRMDFLTARVIGTDPNGVALSPYLIINKGSRDRLRIGMTVVSDRGYFVGSIYELNSTSSKVLLMINPSSSVGALDLRTNAAGLVEGKYAGFPVLDAVVTSATLRVHDFVVTSGQMNLFPRTILLGQITDIRHSNDAMFQAAGIQPMADFSNLEDVQVIRSFVPAVPAKLLGNH